MIVLVTGAAGFVGAHLVRRIAERFPEARVIAADAADPDAPARAFWAPAARRLSAVRLDVTDRMAVRALIAEMRPTHVVHAAAVTPAPEDERRDPMRILDVNLGGTVNVAEAATASPDCLRLIAFSSSAVYGVAPQRPNDDRDSGENPSPLAGEGREGGRLGQAAIPPNEARPDGPVGVHSGPGPAYPPPYPPPQGGRGAFEPSREKPNGSIREDAALTPDGLYGVAKAAGEAVVRRFCEMRGVSGASLRVAGVYGPLERPTAARARMSLVYRLAAALREGRPVVLAGPDIARDFVHADDVAEVVAGLIAAPSLGHPVYNLGSGEAARFRELAAAFERFGLDVRWTDDPAEADIALHRADERPVLSITRLKADIAYAPRPLNEGVAALLAAEPLQETAP